MKKAYEGLNVPTFENTVAGEASTAFAALSKEATEAVELSKARLAELEAQLEVAQSFRLSADTTVEDVYAANPEMQDEILGEIEAEEWAKDVGL